MNKKYIALYSVIFIIIIGNAIYAQQEGAPYNTWTGWPFINGVLAPDDIVITAYNQNGNLVSGVVTYPTAQGIFIVPVEAGDNDLIYFKINNLVTDQQPQQMNVYNGNDCSFFYPEGCDKNVHYLNLTLTDADNDGFARGFINYQGSDKDCNDNNPNINPNAIEQCNGIDDNCNNSIDEGFPDIDNDGYADCVDNDDDNDGVVDEIDNIIGDSSDIDTNIDCIKFKANGVEDLFDYSGVAYVEFLDCNTNQLLLELNYNFSYRIMYLSNISIKININQGEGSIIIKGIDLTGQGVTKTAYINNTSPTNTICIVDDEVAAITVTNDCANGIKVTCDGSNGGYNCTSLNNGTRYKIEGLVHSAVSEYTYTSQSGSSPSGGGGGGGGGSTERTCFESWTCADWSPAACPSTSTQTRTCTDKNNCGTTINKPRETRTCFYYAAPSEEEAKVEETTLTEPSEEKASSPEATTSAERGTFAAITGAVIGAIAGKAGIGILIAVVIIIGGLSLFVKYKRKFSLNP